MGTSKARLAVGGGRAWWIAPLFGAIVSIVGLFATALCLAFAIRTPSCDLKLKIDRPLMPFPPEQQPDLDIAPGSSGYVSSLGMAGRQFHFEEKSAGKTWIAVEMWLHGVPWRIAVAGYDGQPDPGLAADVVRPLDPFLPMLVVRVEGATEVWCEARGSAADRDVQVGAPDRRDGYMGPNPANAGEVNLLVFPGKVALWIDAGPHHEIEVTGAETVWCTLGPQGLVVDRREPTSADRSR